MSGLIWAGIGKGIADAGSTFGNYMAKDIESRMQSEREAQREERLLARQEALDRIKADREEAKAEALKTRVATEAVQVESRAADAPIRRDAAAVSKLGSQVAGDSPVMEQSEIEGVIRENPQYREVYRKAGLIGEDKMDPRLRAADDQSTAALELGAHSSVIDAYAKKRKDVLDQIRLENTEKKNDQQFTATMAAITQRRDASEAKLPIEQQNADANTTRAGAAVTNAAANTTRANRPPSSGGKGGTVSGMSEVKLNQEAETLRKAAKDASTMDLKRDYEARLKEVMDEIQVRRKSGGSAAPKTSDNRTSTSGTPTKNYSNLWK